jgi:2-C-methyl-D-erythritol 4-phosphate cytidylyltransferase
MTTAIVVAAGGSTRMGFDKLSADLCGKAVLLHSILAFDACDAVDDLLVAAGDMTRDLVQGWIKLGLIHKPLVICAGGAFRHLSVHEGLKALPATTDIVAVHDGARPLITPDQIARCIVRARETMAAVCARPVTETLKRVDADGLISDSIDREGLWIMETPQVFDRSLLCQAYDRILEDGLMVTDEVSAVQHFGGQVCVVGNPSPNPKITFPADLKIAAQLLLGRQGK